MSFKSQREIWEHLIKGLPVVNITWEKGHYIILGGEGNLIDEDGEEYLTGLECPNDWQPYTEPKPKRRIELVEHVWNGLPADHAVQWAHKDYKIGTLWKPTGQTRVIEIEDGE